jgi:hypothetical protein
MAYLDLTLDLPLSAPVSADVPPALPAPEEAVRFSALEWQVIAIARSDRMSSLREPSRLTRAFGSVLRVHNPRLADSRLEALRRMAVLSWRHGYVVAPAEVRDFVKAGFSLAQYDLLLDSIAVARSRG